jgi:hypothetical protein
MRTLGGFVVVLLVALGTAAAAAPAPTFHGINLGVSLGSQFKECPWDPPAKGDVPKYIFPPDKDENGNTIPCYHDFGGFRPAAYPQLHWGVLLIEHVYVLKDAQGKYEHPGPSILGPTLNIKVLVPATASLRDGTIEWVDLTYLSLESDRVRKAIVEKFGASQRPGKKADPKLLQAFGNHIISSEIWDTAWGELLLVITDKEVSATAQTFALTRFEEQQQKNKKDEF